MKRLLCFCLLYASPVEADLQRHPLELRALNEPDWVLEQLPAALKVAAQHNDYEQIALLELARANACRVLADWSCQREAGLAAQKAAERANNALLQVRGRVANARANSALQDFSRAEEQLAIAELLLKSKFDPDLYADVYLAYSSISFSLGRFQASRDYSTRGLALFDAAVNAGSAVASDHGMQVRLLRNLARAQIELKEEALAQQSLNDALKLDLQSDQKLRAELHLEAARLARKRKDVDAGILHGDAVLEIADRMNNSQLRGQALEVLGLSALDRKESSKALNYLTQSFSTLLTLDQKRDALRVLREILPLAIASGDPSQTSLMTQMITLQAEVDLSDRSVAAMNFDARLLYAERAFDLERERARAESLAEQQMLVKRNQRLAYTIAGLAVLLSAGAMVFGYWNRQANYRIKSEELRWRSLSEHIPGQIAHIDQEQRYVYANSELLDQLSSRPDDVLGTAFRERSSADRDRMQAYVREALDGKTVRFYEELQQDGQSKSYETIFVPDRDPHQTVRGFFVLRFDVSRIKQAERELEEMASIDGLTGLANRRRFEAKLAHNLQQPLSDTMTALFWIDIDHFKSINDQYGHLMGDNVLRTVANRLRAAVRHGDLVARMGGDEFMIILDQLPNNRAAILIAEKIIASMQQAVVTEVGEILATVSIGIAFHGEGRVSNNLLSDADQALYAAKNDGRNAYRVFGSLQSVPSGAQVAQSAVAQAPERPAKAIST